MKDCRRIPTGGEFMEDKAISDLLYAWLQCNSRWRQGESHRYIDKKEVKMARLARGLGCDRRTIARQLNSLLEKGFLVEENGFYLLPPVGDYYFLVPAETLNYLLDTRSPNVIKVYCYLGNLYHYYGKDAYFTQNSLLEAIGYSSTKGDNHQLIRNILFALEVQDKVIRFKREVRSVNGTTIKIYRLTGFSKTVKGLTEYEV